MGDNIWFLFGLVLLGMGAQFVKKLADLEASGTLLTPCQYMKDKPWRTALAILSGLILAYTLHLMGQLNEAAAIGVGLACTDAFDSLRARAAGRIGEMTGRKHFINRSAV